MSLEERDPDPVEEVSQRRTLKVDRRICPHCDKNVSFKTYRLHKRLFYDSSVGTWITADSPGGSAEDDVNLIETKASSSPPKSTGILNPDNDSTPFDYSDPPCADYGKHVWLCMYINACNVTRAYY